MFVAEVSEIHHTLTCLLLPTPRLRPSEAEDTFDVVLRSAEIQRFCKDWQLAVPQGWGWEAYLGYPLVICHIAVENHHF